MSAGLEARAELLRALGVLAEPPGPTHGPISEALGLEAPPNPAEYAEVFTFNVYPYASVYLGAEGQLGGEARARIVGFWSAVGLEAPGEPDHLASLLGLLASLLDRVRSETDPTRKRLLSRAVAACSGEHLTSWLPPFLHAVRSQGSEYYAAWADQLHAALHVGVPEVEDRVGADAVHLVEAPQLDTPEVAGGTAFLTQLLAPVRTGFVLTRNDLARLGAELGLGGRAGERQYVLRAYLGQDAQATFAWLGDFAAEWAAAPKGESDVAVFWSDRAKRASQILADASTAAAGDDFTIDGSQIPAKEPQ